MKKQPGSLRFGVLTTIVVCWLLPVLIIVGIAGIVLDNSFQRSIQQEVDTSAKNALTLVGKELSHIISDSKAVSYDGMVRSAYRLYQQDGDSAQLYRKISDYLNQNFSRSDRYNAVFISFWNPDISMSPYIIPKGTHNHSILETYQAMKPDILEQMQEIDTEIRFLLSGENLYMARNLLDSNFSPYATVVSWVDVKALFFPISAISPTHGYQAWVDDCDLQFDKDGRIHPIQTEKDAEIYYETQVEGHLLAFCADAAVYSIWEYIPLLRWAVLAVALLVVPMVLLVIVLFTRNVNHPVEVLAKANREVQNGQRGYAIREKAPNAEFMRLFDNFNAMSAELENQFERSYLEQQATAQAKIKALQSQINPHFLNNTLEIINWEARIAEDERVCAMIEALSTMLDAALDRDGRSQIPLREELGYVDAYLYIICQRLGEELNIEKDIEDPVLEQLIPRLIIQPLVENAVEHDLSDRHGGNLWIRAYRQENNMILEVEHDGSMTEEDRKKIRMLLSGDQEILHGAQVGLRNVNQRLGLLYGDLGSLTMGETDRGTILARICFPI